MKSEELRFEFGKNWKSYIKNALDDKSIEQAVQGLKRLLVLDSLEGKTFLDIGCGSGLSSLSACLLGAKKVISFDYDANSMEAGKMLRDKAGVSPELWSIQQGSILDNDFLATLEKTDIVYSWGVLHHTGEMWKAIDNATTLTKPGGLFAISIYNKAEGRRGSEKAWHIKKKYVNSSRFYKKLKECQVGVVIIAKMVLLGKNPFAIIKNYGETAGRGMDFWHDLRDWLGGFPYEYATAGEVFNYVHKTNNMNLIYLNTRDMHFCNEFTFKVL